MCSPRSVSRGRLRRSDFGESTKLFEKYRPTYVIHLAALGQLYATLILAWTADGSRRPVCEHVEEARFPAGQSVNQRRCATERTRLQGQRASFLYNDKRRADDQVKKVISCLSTCVFPDKVSWKIQYYCTAYARLLIRFGKRTFIRVLHILATLDTHTGKDWLMCKTSQLSCLRTGNKADQ